MYKKLIVMQSTPTPHLIRMLRQQGVHKVQRLVNVGVGGVDLSRSLNADFCFGALEEVNPSVARLGYSLRFLQILANTSEKSIYLNRAAF